MAVRIFDRLLSPLMQSLKYSANNNIVAARSSKFTSELLINVRRWQTSSNNSKVPEKELVQKDGQSITLVFPGGAIHMMTLAEAKTIAKKRNSKLITVRDDLDCRVVYRLIPSDTKKNCKGNEGVKETPRKKDPKILNVMTTTTKQDLLIKCKKIVKMLQNDHSVLINIYNAEKRQRITKTSEEEIKEIFKKSIQEFGTVSEEINGGIKTAFTIIPRNKDVPQE